MYANGMTDDWFDFMNGFEEVLKDNQVSLSADEKNIADDLLFKLKKSLTDRQGLFVCIAGLSLFVAL